jgi:hypothetical protein
LTHELEFAVAPSLDFVLADFSPAVYSLSYPGARTEAPDVSAFTAVVAFSQQLGVRIVWEEDASQRRDGPAQYLVLVFAGTLPWETELHKPGKLRQSAAELRMLASCPVVSHVLDSLLKNRDSLGLGNRI